jgi:putative transposase
MLVRQLPSTSPFAREFARWIGNWNSRSINESCGNSNSRTNGEDTMGWKNIYLDNHSYFFTSRIVDSIPILGSRRLKGILLDLVNFYRKEYKTKIQAYVIMPTHLHLIVNLQQGENIKLFIQNLLRKTSIRIVEHFEKNLQQKIGGMNSDLILKTFRDHANPPSQHAVWKEKSRGVPVYTDRVMKVKLDYIHNNPVRAGLVTEPRDYIYSSFRNYYLNDHSIFRVDTIDILNLEYH